MRRGLLAHIRAGILRPGVVLPSTRALAAQLGISRPLIVDAYAQLAAEGFLIVRRGARPIVASGAARVAQLLEERREQPIRYDLRPAMPDVGFFPRKAWASAIRTVLNAIPANDLGMGTFAEARGCDQRSPTILAGCGDSSLIHLTSSSPVASQKDGH